MESIEVRRDDRLYVRVDDSRARSFILTRLGKDLRRYGDGEIGIGLAKYSAERSLVLGIPVRVQEADGEALGAGTDEHFGLPERVGDIEGDDDRSVATNAFVDLTPHRPVDKRDRLLPVEVVGLWELHPP